MTLTKQQREALARHKKHHSQRHMDHMKREMLKGKSFTEAHKIASGGAAARSAVRAGK